MDPQNVAPPVEATGPPPSVLEDLGLPPADAAASPPEPGQPPSSAEAPQTPPEPEQRAGEADAAFAERERRYQEDLQRERQARQDAENRIQQYNAAIQQAAHLAEQQREQRLLDEVKDLHPDEAITRVRAYYQERVQRQQQHLHQVQQAQQMATYQQAIQAWAAEHARANGLGDDDLVDLLQVADPDQIPLRAQRIKQQRDAQAAKDAEWQRKLDQVALQQQATQMTRSGAHAVGGTGQGAATDQPTPGSREQLLAIAGDFFDF